MTPPPYKAERRANFWIAVDRRTGRAVSYPTSDGAQARREAAILNAAHRDAILEGTAL